MSLVDSSLNELTINLVEIFFVFLLEFLMTSTMDEFTQTPQLPSMPKIWSV